MITVAVAEDQVLMLDMLVQVINNFEGIRVVARALDGLELVDQLKTMESPDILLLDFRMRHMGGLPTAIWMKEHHPSTRILMLSSFDSDIIMVRLIKAGVRGFITKAIKVYDLEKALRQIMVQNTYFLQEGADKLAILFREMEEGTTFIKKGLLNDREIDYIKHCCSDDTRPQIAEKMNVSLRTLNDISADIFEKINVKGRPLLVMYAINEGLIFL